MKPALTLDELVDEEVEDWQYEHSSDLAADFVESAIMPALLDFENNNGDDKYIAGIAAYTLFCRLIAELGAQGFEAEELAEQIEYYIHLAQERTLN